MSFIESKTKVKFYSLNDPEFLGWFDVFEGQNFIERYFLKIDFSLAFDQKLHDWRNK